MQDHSAIIRAAAVPLSTSADRIDEAVEWAFRVEFGVDGDARRELAFDVGFNDDPPIAYRLLLENAGGEARFRVLHDHGPAARMELPDYRAEDAGGAFRFRDAEGRFLSTDDAVEMTFRTIVFDRLDVRRLQCVRPSIGTTRLAADALPLIEHQGRIVFAQSPASLAQHLADLLAALVDGSPFAAVPVEIRVAYAYRLADVPVVLPVVLVQRQEMSDASSDLLAVEIAYAVQSWLEETQPPTADAELLLDVTCFSALAGVDVPLLNLPNVVIPMTLVSG